MNNSAYSQLHEEFRRLIGMPELEMTEILPGTCASYFSSHGVEIQLGHFFFEPDVVHLIAVICDAPPDGLSIVTYLAETNAWLLSSEESTVICKRNYQNDYAVRRAIELEHCNADILFGHVQSVAQAVLAMRRELNLPS